MNRSVLIAFILLLSISTITSGQTNISKPDEKSASELKQIAVDRENGFYQTVNYSSSSGDKNIELEKKPSLVFKDILIAEKVIPDGRKPMISITLTKRGAERFYELTSKNVGKPVPIVIDKQIVSMPVVQMGISGGKLNITGDFSEIDIDAMVKKLNSK
jgi:preprotein translocase subunit SecD